VAWGGWVRIGTVTATPRPDGSGPTPARGPDTTDPDLQPVLPYQDGTAAPAGEPEPLDTGVHEAVEAGISERPAASEAVAQRLARRPRDMFMALGVLLVVIFVLLGIYRCTGGDQTPTVDTGSAYEQARSGNAFPLLEPKGLAAKWRPVSALYQPDPAGSVLRIGYETPGGGTLQLVEGNVDPDTMLNRELGSAAKATGQVDIGGRSWQRYTARKGEHALVLKEPERTVIVVGAASEAEVQALAAALA
jgi:hypothetical protein